MKRPHSSVPDRPESSVPPSPVEASLRQLHEQLLAHRDGDVATYIPELAKADPEWFGICLATASGSVYEVGDTSVPFTIQSISKPFVYGLALEDHGRTAVLEKVGVEPTGEAFNSISLEPGTGRPRNPMINAGAIATTGLISGKSQASRLRRVIEMLGRHAGRDLDLDGAVYASESETGHRNRAIGYMLRNFGILGSDPMPVVELYFQQCSVRVTCRDLGIMAATLANRGVNPVTGEQALRGEYVESVLSVMESCGMYDASGQWLYHVGMPAKSGVSGGIIAVLPGQLGLGVFSPRLDAQGNSARGIQVARDLSRYLNLHQLNSPPLGQNTLRRHLTGTLYSSNQLRTPDRRHRLMEIGSRIHLLQLQGELSFTTTEVVVRHILDLLPAVGWVVLDLKRVLSLDESACYLLHQLQQCFLAGNQRLAYAHTQHLPLLRRYLKRKFGPDFDRLHLAFSDADRALEWAENEALHDAAPASEATLEPPCLALEGLNPDQLAAVRARLQRREFHAGETLVQAGDLASEMFLLTRGRVSVVLETAAGETRRLATFTAGMNFGEMAMLDGSPRSARIVADTDGACDVLSASALADLEATAPAAALRLLRNLCMDLSRRLRTANSERAVLD